MDTSEAQAILGLADLERAYAIERLMKTYGTQFLVAGALGVPAPRISQYMSILKLCDKAKELLDPTLPEGERFYSSAAHLLAKYPEDLQLAALIGLKRCNSSQEQRKQLRMNLKKYYDAKWEARRKLMAGASVSVTTLPPARIVERGPPPEVITPRLVSQIPVGTRTASATRSQSFQRSMPLPKFKPRSLETRTYERAWPRAVLASPSSEPAAVSRNRMDSLSSSDITIQYWDDVNSFRYVLKKVDMQEYAKLWHAKKLMFQRENMPRPAHYPDLDATDT